MGRSKLLANFQTVFVLATTLKLQKGARSLSTNTVELANDGHGEQRISRKAGDGVTVAESEIKLYPELIDGEVVARGAGVE